MQNTRVLPTEFWGGGEAAAGLALLGLRLSLSAGAFRATPVEDLSFWGCNCGGEKGEEGGGGREHCGNENEKPHQGGGEKRGKKKEVVWEALPPRHSHTGIP